MGGRHEVKYLISMADLLAMDTRLRPLMQIDSHAGTHGKYLIRSIYLDDVDHTYYYENLAGVAPREKWRIRAYNCDPSRISLECKMKDHDLTKKDTCILSMEQYQTILAGGLLPIQKENSALLNRFALLQRTRVLKPSVIVQYVRKPYVYRQGNVRVTFDMNIASSSDYDRFFDMDLPVRPVLETGRHILEVKYDAYLPDSIYHAAQNNRLQRTSFSKYSLCARYSLTGGLL